MAKKNKFWEYLEKFKKRLVIVFTILVITGTIMGFLGTQFNTLINKVIEDSESFKKYSKQVRNYEKQYKERIN